MADDDYQKLYGYTPQDISFHPEIWSPRPGQWTVHISPPNNGATNNKDRRVWVPYPFTDIQVAIRYHEAYHILLSPEEPFADYTEQMVEEVLVDSAAIHDGLSVQTGLDLFDKKFLQQAHNLTTYDWCMWMLQFTGCGYDSAELDLGNFVPRKDAPTDVKNLLGQIRQGLGDEYSFVQQCILEVWNDPSRATAKQVTDKINQHFPHPTMPNMKHEHITLQAGVTATGKPMPISCGHYIVGVAQQNGQFNELIVVSAPIEQQTSDALRKLAQLRSNSGGKPLVSQHGHNWYSGTLTYFPPDSPYAKRSAHVQGKMLVEDFTATTVQIRRIQMPTGRQRTPSSKVVRPMAMWNDGRIYQSRRPGGSIAIDISGSMDWDWDEMARAVQELPSMVIGLYSGSCRAEGANGKMLIIAKDGRFADPRRILPYSGMSSGNAVDIEAMDWLGKQPEPRVWLGDGEVHSGLLGQMNASQNQSGNKHLRAICQQHRIVRVRKVEDALRVLRRGGAWGCPNTYTWASSQLCS